MTTTSEVPAGASTPARALPVPEAAGRALDTVIETSRVSTLDGGETARAGLPVKPPLTAVIEILLLIVLPAALDLFVPGFPTLYDLQPHPFWLPVLLVSIQYGTVSGLLAAGCAVAANTILGWPEQEVGENHFTYLLRVWTQPMLWVAAALVLGQFRMRQIERKEELMRQVAELHSHRKAIADYAANLRTRCERLERELVGRRSPDGRDILALLGGLSQSSGSAARAELDACLQAAFGACEASLYVRNGDELRLLESFRWSAKARWKTSLTAADPLFMAMNTAAKPLSVMMPGDEAALSGEGMAAVPIVSQVDGRMIGMIKLEDIDPSEIDASLGRRLSALASHLAPLLEGANPWHPSNHAANTPSSRAAPSAALRPRLWRQVRWSRGDQHAQTSQRPTGTR